LNQQPALLVQLSKLYTFGAFNNSNTFTTHTLVLRKRSTTVASFLPIPLIGFPFRLAVLLGVSTLIGVVLVLGSTGHARGFLFRRVLSDLHSTTSFGAL